MIHATDQLSGHLLNYAIARALGFEPEFQYGAVASVDPEDPIAFDTHDYVHRHAQSGPLIDQYGISTRKVVEYGCGRGAESWHACRHEGGRAMPRHEVFTSGGHAEGTFWQAGGRSRVEAALRCLALSLLGEKIDIPDAFVDAAAVQGSVDF